jgi:hypothetical protein
MECSYLRDKMQFYKAFSGIFIYNVQYPYDFATTPALRLSTQY